jgi:hypothetical protein
VSLEMAKWKNDEMAKIKPAGILPFRPFRHSAISTADLDAATPAGACCRDLTTG